MAKFTFVLLTLWLGGDITAITAFTPPPTDATTTTTVREMRRLPRPLAVARDDYLRPHFTIIAAADDDVDTVQRMTECASSDGLCDVEELQGFLRDLEDNRGQNPSDDERDVILKQALDLQVQLAQTRHAMTRLQEGRRLDDDGDDDDNNHSHSNKNKQRDDSLEEYFVKYRSMAEFESH